MSKKLDEEITNIVARAKDASFVDEPSNATESDENLFDGDTVAEKKMDKDKDMSKDKKMSKGKGMDKKGATKFIGKDEKDNNVKDVKEAEKDPNTSSGSEMPSRLSVPGDNQSGNEKDPNSAKGTVDNPLPNVASPVIVDPRTKAWPAVKKASMAAASSEDATKALSRVGEELELSPEAIDKIAPVFEGLVLSKVEKGIEAGVSELNKIYAEKLEEEKAKLVITNGKFVEYASDRWFKENELALEQSIKSELTYNLAEGFIDVLKKFNIEMPEGSEDMVTKVTTERNHYKDLSNELTEELIAERSKNYTEVKNKIIDELGKEAKLSEAKIDKLRVATESQEFTGSDNFRTIIKTMIGEINVNEQSDDKAPVVENIDNGEEPVFDAKDVETVEEVTGGGQDKTVQHALLRLQGAV
ncbi:MAG: hypothetical protein HAW67_06780 [Endozoicomonadaceae bacterium]|nr:hypothetical protein [Endozoicomonadaceae bacterium]